MTKEEAEKYIKSKMCNNCGVYLGGGKCSNNCTVIEAIKALKSQMDWDELKRKILMEVDGGTDDKWLRCCDVCDRISNSIDEYIAEKNK